MQKGRPSDRGPASLAYLVLGAVFNCDATNVVASVLCSSHGGCVRGVVTHGAAAAPEAFAGAARELARVETQLAAMQNIPPRSCQLVPN